MSRRSPSTSPRLSVLKATGRSGNPKRDLTDRVLVDDLHVGDSRVARTHPAPGHQPGHGILLAFEARLDAAVGPVPNPSSDAGIHRDAAACVSEKDALYPAIDHDPPADDHRCAR
jgi:hypothetical protein